VAKSNAASQLIQQKVPKLVVLGSVIRWPAPDDQRVILIETTDKEREQLALLEFDRAYGEMEEDAGPVFDGIRRATSALKSRPLIDRIVG